MEDKKEKMELTREFREQEMEEIAKWLTDFFRTRLDRYKAPKIGSTAQWLPDFRCDLLDLINSAIDGTEAILLRLQKAIPGAVDTDESGKNPICLSVQPISVDCSKPITIAKVFIELDRKSREFCEANNYAKAAAVWLEATNDSSFEDSGLDWFFEKMYSKATKLLKGRFSEAEREQRAQALLHCYEECMERKQFFAADDYAREIYYYNNRFAPLKTFHCTRSKHLERLNCIWEATKTLQGEIDDDLFAQWQHCKEQLNGLRWKSCKLLIQKKEETREYINHCMIRAYTILIKLRSIMDQSFSRTLRILFGKSGHIIIQSKCIEAGNSEKFIEKLKNCFPSECEAKKIEEFLEREESKKWIELFEGVQVYKDASFWWKHIITVSNQAKHVRQRYPTVEELQQRINKLQARETSKFFHPEEILFFRIEDTNFFHGDLFSEIKSACPPNLKIEVGNHLLDVLLNKNYLSKKDFGSATKKLLDCEDEATLKSQLVVAWSTKLPSGEDFSLEWVDVDNVVSRLWSHREWKLGTGALLYANDIPIIPTLDNAIQDIFNILQKSSEIIHNKLV